MSNPYDRPSDPAKRHSAALTDGVDRAAARAMLKGTGFDDDDLARPLVGVATSWIETMPCNLNQRKLAVDVKRGIRAAGGTPIEFNTIAVSDGVSMGSEGMRASLVSREVIADSIELVARGHLFDGLVVLVGCDKTIPSAVMALARLDLPGARSLQRLDRAGPFPRSRRDHPGRVRSGRRHAAGTMSAEDVHELEGVACPGAGACGGQFTANTMSLALEFLGISPAGLNGIPALHPAKAEAAEPCGSDRARSRARRRSSFHDPHARVDRECDRRGRRDRRLDQRRPPPARDRARARPAARARRLRRDRARARRSSPISSRVDASSPPTSVAPAAWSRRAGARGAGLADGSTVNVDGRTLAEIAAAAEETPGRRSSCPSTGR